jgi:glycosyltransferase involved in cell wall biosynthesis
MKKINYIHFSSIPSNLPSSLQVIKTCENFSKNNYKVTLIKPGTGNKKTSIKKYYGLKYDIRIKEFKSIKSFPLGLKFYLYCIYCLFFILTSKKSVNISRSYFITFLLLLFKQKVILEIHHDTKGESRVAKFILKYLNFLNDKNLINIVAVTNSVKNLFIKKYNVKSKKITVLPSGSSIRLNFKPSLNFGKRMKIGYFGSISPSKGINTIIKLSKIDRDNDYFIFGGLKSQIRKLKKKNFNKNLFFNENIPYVNLPETMLSMDILTIPYTNQIKSAGEVDDISKFTSPLKLFDYLAVGKIILSSDLTVLREVIDTKNAIFIKNFENIFSWKQKINYIKNNKNKLYIMCNNNLILSKQYDHSSRIKKYINFEL